MMEDGKDNASFSACVCVFEEVGWDVGGGRGLRVGFPALDV